ncbi:alpha/beta fold hydrolase [Paenibacillus sabinae]|uniref:Alpha/beta hydrolase n=1 Tax=Paenibacillus sabinae T27 TaxID=1268072 RepID=X4ZCJ9_9BACL|nr:alpha/beta hydrolase [Paenibacillus sabinae]AHV95237.1 alpha/beta hydrolase [Paenibacillus sabinae T27]
MPYCQTGKAELYYEDWGEGRPIVMIHGFSPDHRLMSGCMEPVFRERKGWRRLYIDLPGMGKSRHYQDIRSSDEMLEAVLSFLDIMLPGETYCLAGGSYGGYIVRGIIAERPEQVDGAALICPMIIPEKEDRKLPAHSAVYTDVNFVEKLTKEQRDDFSSIGVVLDEYTWNRYNEEILSGIRLADEDFLAAIKARYGFSFPVDQEEFHKPGLLVTGRQDAVTGYIDAFSILNKYTRTSFAVLDRAGHNLQIEQPELFNALVQEWLNRVEEDGNK